MINYGPLFGLDAIALIMRAYYAYTNRYRNVRIIGEEYIENPLQDLPI
jgi:hypothetical protein